MNKTTIRHGQRQAQRSRAAQFSHLIAVLQQRFGYSRERAGRELRRRLAKHPAHVAAR